ncbi:XRE family transcriptional regulator [Afipia carboxidovorans]|uniref:XRE family transcriptional regulator n=1 Tax=Afipia carboxidovorans TaxID=40137 RepID=UPI003087A916|nr:hypothetical protein CRBSH125_13780 [Afipia carboxidovorans]
MITGSQCRAARALVEISRSMLAKRAGVDLISIERFENITGSLVKREMQDVKRALEELGAVFIPENGAGHGVRLKFSNVTAERIAQLECEGGIVAHDRVP